MSILIPKKIDDIVVIKIIVIIIIGNKKNIFLTISDIFWKDVSDFTKVGRYVLEQSGFFPP